MAGVSFRVRSHGMCRSSQSELVLDGRFSLR
jgi:hypothetical protein